MFSQEQLAALKNELIAGADDDYLSGLFNENLKSTFSPGLINELKFAPRIASKILFPLLMHFPFDPLTGKETEKYSARTKRVLSKAPDMVMAMIKAECHANEELKRLYMRAANFRGTWDTASPGIDSPEDKLILWRYRRPMGYILPSIRIVSKGIGGDSFPTVYLLDSKQDPMTGAFVGDLSVMHKLGLLVNSLIKNEIDSFNRGIETKNVDTVSRAMKRSFALSADYLKDIPSVDHNDAKARRGDIRGAYPIGGPQPLVLTIGLKFNVVPKTGALKQQGANKKFELLTEFTDEIDFNSRVVFTSKYPCQAAIDAIIGNYYPKDPTKYLERDNAIDLYPNYCVIDFITEDTRETLTKEQKMEVAKDMKYMSEKKPLFNLEDNAWADPKLAQFDDRMRGFFAYAEEENIFMKLYDNLKKTYKPVSKTMEAALISELRQKYSPSTPVYTAEILAMHNELLQDIFPTEIIGNDAVFETLETKGDELFQQLQEQINSGNADYTASDEEVEEVPDDEFDDDIDSLVGGAPDSLTDVDKVE